MMLKFDRPRPVTINVDSELDRILVERALEERTSRSDIARRLLRRGLAAENADTPAAEADTHR